MTISVIIPTHNRPGPLHRALRSLARQTFRDFEVIVIQDGATNVEHIVKKWVREFPITHIDLGTSHGASAARNRGISAAAGEFLAFLDDDDVFLPSHLEAAHHTLSRGGADAVYGGALVSPRWIEATPRDTLTMARKDYPFDPRFLLAANYIHTSSIVCRHYAHTTARFDEQLTHCEDWDMWLTLHHQLGYRFQHLGTITSVYHQLPRTSGAVADAYTTTPTPFTRARTYLFSKWPTHDHHIQQYRDWFTQFDTRLDARISTGHPIPAHIYEQAIAALHPQFTRGEPPAPPAHGTLLPEMETADAVRT